MFLQATMRAIALQQHGSDCDASALQSENGLRVKAGFGWMGWALLFVAIYASYWAACVLLALLLWRSGYSLEDFGIRRLRRQEILVVLTLAGATTVFIYGTEWLTYFPLLRAFPESTVEWLWLFVGGPAMSGALHMVGIILFATFEEVVFRHILLLRFSHRWGLTRGVFAVSVLFAVLHYDPIGTFVFSIAACLIYLGSRNILLPILFHAFVNYFALIVPRVTPLVESYDGFAEAVSASYDDNGMFAVLGLIVGGAVISLYAKAQIQFRPWRQSPR